jgi:hypothetical protein
MPLFCGEDLNFGAFSKYFSLGSEYELVEGCGTMTTHTSNFPLGFPCSAYHSPNIIHGMRFLSTL